MKQITSFWRWFADNESAIKMAVLIGLNSDEVFFHLYRNLDYVSKRIGILIIGNSESPDKCKIVFTAYGYPKLFAKITALEDLAPQLDHFTVEAFIKPSQVLTRYKEKTDKPFVCQDYSVRISDMQMELINYDTNSKKLKIKIYMPGYDAIKQLGDIDSKLKFLVMQIVGEIAFRKNIKKIEFAQLPKPAIGLLSIVELPELLDSLYKINSREKTRVI